MRIVTALPILAAPIPVTAQADTARLAPDVRSFAEVIGHIIETNFGVCAGSRKETNPKKG